MSNDTTGNKTKTVLVDSLQYLSPTDIGEIYESEPVQDCQSSDAPDPGSPQKAKSSHKQNARKQAKRNRK